MYSIGDHVWVRDGASYDSDLPKGCSITKIDKKKIQVQDDDGKVEWITAEKIVKPIHASSVTPVDDMIQLGELDEHVILRNLLLRYKNQAIYTYIGDMLIAVNPYQVLNIYSTSEVSTYSAAAATDTLPPPPPHIFATSDKCFKTMRITKQNQCILISGESGAGKTESTKLILQYLTAISAGGHSWIKQQILEANPILEAFGNAKTQRNDNSSRFGKYINVHFNSSGEIEGAKIDHYLLEKSRIVTHSKNERNYHIFYALLAGLSVEEKRKLYLGNASDYKYLQGTATCKGRVDAKTYADVKAAMQIMNYDEKTLSNVVALLAMILHLGNLKYKEVIVNHTDGTEINDAVCLKRLSEFLAVDERTLTDVLTKRSIYAKEELLVSNLSKCQAFGVRDALAKIIYEKMFERIVKDINRTIQNAKTRAKLSIGILDMSGFENFDANSFEQLCINYANEHLQQFFVQSIFKIEQENYASEGIAWSRIDFVDNQEIIDLIGVKPLNAMSLIDEESIFPKGSDASMLSKISLIHGTNKNFIKPRANRMKEFGIVHFAGPVLYDVNGFLDKNRDNFSRDFKRLLAASDNAFLKNLFAKKELITNGDANKRSATMSAKFRESLESLLGKLHSCNPYFVRCIKPNESQSPEIFDRQLCIRQLRYSGLTDTARIRKAGYSVHYEYTEFAVHFRALVYDVDPGRRNDHKYVTAKICSRTFSDGDDYRLGHTKLFLKETHNAVLEKLKNDVLGQRALVIQRNLRMWVARKRYLQMRKSAITIQKTWRAHGPRKTFLELRGAIQRLQSRIRSRWHEAEFQKKRRIVISLQAQCRRHLVQKSCAEKREQLRMKKMKALQNRIETKMRNASRLSRGEQPTDNNIDTMFDFLNDEAKLRAPSREDVIRRELASKSSFRIPSEINDSEITSYDFYKFAAIYFTGNATPSFSKKPLKQSLLDLPHLSDQLAAKALSMTIMRFMGDLSEPDDNPSSDDRMSDNRAVMRKVTESLTRSFSRTDSYSKAMMMTRESRQLLKRTLRKKNKLNNVITEGIVNDEYENWLSSERSNMEKLHFIVGHGILRPVLKDEIYCQIVKQLINNPSKTSRNKGWVLLSLSIGCFAPSEKFINYLKSFIKSGPSEYAPYCEKRLMRTYGNGSRTQPPCWIEMESVKFNEPITLKVTLADGNLKTIIADSASTAREMVNGLADGLKLKDTFGFSLYITIDDKVLSLGAETDHVMDAISQCEQYAKEQGHSERNATWKLLFRKEMFAPWHDPSIDAAATDLIYHQVCKGIKHGEYRCHGENDIAQIIAQQLYVQYGAKTTMPTNIKTILRANMPNPLLQANADQVLVRLEKRIVDIYRKDYATLRSISQQKVKESIVLYAKNTWPLFFSKFYEVTKIFGPELDVADIVIGVNSTGVYFFDDKERVLQQFSYAEISEVNYQKNDNILLHNFTLSTIQREEFVFQSTSAESFVLLVNYIMEGLRRKSTYVVAIQDFVAIDNSQSLLPLKKGDIVQLVEGCTGKTIMTSTWGAGEKNGVQGKFPCEFVFILPTLEKPSPPLIEFFKVDFTSKTVKSTKKPNQNSKDFKYHNLKKFASEHFRPSIKAISTTGISSAKSSVSEELWKHTREPIKVPLLAKLSNEEEQFQQAIYVFRSILKYMGDLPSNRQRIGTVYTDRIFGPALKDGLIRDEAYCQIMRQLTENEIPLSEERGWELMWLATGIMPCSLLVRKELEAFLNSRETLLAQDCLNRLNRITKSGSIRIHPPCILEVEAVRFKKWQIFHKVYFPDTTDAAFEVHSSTRAMDTCDEISTKLQLRSRDGFSLFFRTEDRVISVPNYYFFFDFVREVIDWIGRMSSDVQSNNESQKVKYQVLFMRKIWINCLPGHDRSADARFHFYQEATKYLQGYHKCDKKDAIELAALIYISGHGDSREELAQMHLKLQEYVPGDIIDIMTPKEWKKRLTAAYNHYKGLSQDQAKQQFLQRVYQWPTFGSAFFDVRQSTDSKFPEYIVVAINKNGVTIIDCISKDILAMYSFTDISNWSSGATYFHMTIGNFVNGRKLLCETVLGYKMDDLISSYIGYLHGKEDRIYQRAAYGQRSYSRSNSV